VPRLCSTWPHRPGLTRKCVLRQIGEDRLTE
jgi:hypothetical protein